MLINFLNTYTVDEFIGYTIALFLLLVAAIKTFDYLNERFKIFETRKSKSQQMLCDMSEKINLLLDKSACQERRINTLLESDMVRIKGEIIQKHREYTRLGYIDYKTLDYLQRQFKCYEAEGGNSYIHNLMDDLEDLPLND